MKYQSHLVKNDEKSVKYSYNANGHESTRISEHICEVRETKKHFHQSWSG